MVELKCILIPLALVLFLVAQVAFFSPLMLLMTMIDKNIPSLDSSSTITKRYEGVFYALSNTDGNLSLGLSELILQSQPLGLVFQVLAGISAFLTYMFLLAFCLEFPKSGRAWSTSLISLLIGVFSSATLGIYVWDILSSDEYMRLDELCNDPATGVTCRRIPVGGFIVETDSQEYHFEPISYASYALCVTIVLSFVFSIICFFCCGERNRDRSSGSLF